MATFSWHQLPDWFAAPLGQRLLAEQAPHLAEIARRFHGDTLLWAGCQTNLAETVRGCMIRHRFYTLCSVAPQDTEAGSVFDCNLQALPLPNAALDAMVVHHGLEAAADSRMVLREIARVMAPGGRLVICGFNPYSLWGLRNLMARFSGGSLGGLRLVSPARIVDWLTVLGFELSDEVVHLAYGLPFLRANTAQRESENADGWHPRQWAPRMRKVLRRHRPPFGGVYIISAFKQVGAVRPDLTVAQPSAGKLAPVAYPKLSAWNRIER